MSPDDRRPFRGAPFERGRNERPPGPPGPDRGDQRPADRPAFGAPRPFVRPPTRGGDMAQPDHRVRIRDGEREVEVSGNPAFVRQVLDDLPSLMARLRGAAPGRTAISMPAPPEANHGTVEPRSSQQPGVTEMNPAAGPPGSNGDGGANGRRTATKGSSLEERVFEVLRGSGRPLAVAAIRQRLDGADVTGQQVRRLLERAGPRVVMSAERPATYSLR